MHTIWSTMNSHFDGDRTREREEKNLTIYTPKSIALYGKQIAKIPTKKGVMKVKRCDRKKNNKKHHEFNRVQK